MNRKLACLSGYAIAMAALEAIVVVYLRMLYYPEDVRLIFPLKFMTELDFVLELGREAATVAMILAVAALSEWERRGRVFAAFIYVFGVWEVFYYVWLKVMIGWPMSWLEWDVLFLMPWIWLGPWICPVMIALLFIVWGSRTLRIGGSGSFSKMALVLFVGGSILCIVTFLQPAIPILVTEGVEGMQDFVPTTFWWWVFLPGYGLMMAGMARAR